MTLILRNDVTIPLTNEEIDGNFIHIRDVASSALAIANNALAIANNNSGGGSGVTLLWSIITADTTAIINNAYAVDSSFPVTITLPAIPANNGIIRIMDFSQNSSTFPITINNNGNEINGALASLILDVDSVNVELTYVAGNGWLITNTGNYNVFGSTGSSAPAIDLSGYAPLSSPSFTGNPTAPTPTLTDSDTSIATTSFVRQLAGSKAGVAIISSTTTLDGSHLGKLIVPTGGTYTITLPSVSGLPVGTGMELEFRTSLNPGAIVTIVANGSDVIGLGNGHDSISAVSLKNGDSLTLVSTGGAGWYASGGSAQEKMIYDASLGSSGYQKLSSGLILRWGSAIVSTANVDLPVTLPIPFPTAAVQVITSCSSVTSYGGGGVVNNSTINVWANNPGAGIEYLVIGY